MTTTDTTATTHLTTGWEPGLDYADSFLRRYLFAWAAQCEAFTSSVGGRTEHHDTWVLSDAPHPTGLFNAVTLLAPLPVADADPTMAAIEAAIDDGPGRGEVHLWSAWPTADLTGRGWNLVGHPPLLARPPASLAGIPTPLAPVTLRSVDDPDDLVRWERVIVEGFPLDDAAAAPGRVAGSALLRDPRLALTLGADDDGVPISAAARFVHDELGLFALAATQPAGRGRGHWRGHAIARLRAEPDRWMAGVFSDDSRPLAEAIGFIPLQRFTLWARPRP